MLDKRQREIYRFFPSDSPLSAAQYVERLIEWITFFRRNVTVFIEQYLGIPLHLYQAIFLHAMWECNTVWIIAGRATAKSYLIAIFAVAKCILYPGSKVVIASSTMGQAKLIVKEKIQGELCARSERLCEETRNIVCNARDAYVDFNNGSRITVVVGNENARGCRATVMIYEECRMMKKSLIDSVFEHFLILRYAPYMDVDEYSGLAEPTVRAYITSSWYADSWIWPQFDKALEEALRGENSIAIGTDYAVTLRHGIKSVADMRKLRKQQARETWDLECLNLRVAENTESFFKLPMFTRAQVIRKAFYPRMDGMSGANPYAIPRMTGEVRILFADLAFASGNRNDNSIYGCMRLLPHARRDAGEEGAGSDTIYRRQVVYIESINGGDTIMQAVRLKQLFTDFDADYLVMDGRYAGISVYDILSKPTYDEERDVTYDAWSCMNNEEYARRAAPGAKACVHIVIGGARINSDIAQALSRTLCDGELELLVSYEEAMKSVLPRDKNYTACVTEDALLYEAPYAETQELIKECVDLRCERMEASGTIRVVERAGRRKDRYSALSYGNYFATMLEREAGEADEAYGFCAFYS